MGKHKRKQRLRFEFYKLKNGPNGGFVSFIERELKIQMLKKLDIAITDKK